MNFDSAFDAVYTARLTRAITFRKAVLSGGAATYPSDAVLQVGVRYNTMGFDPFRGVLYPRNDVEVMIWLRDWFGRSTDGATNAELAQLVMDLRGAVVEGDPINYSRFLVDGQVLRYDGHQLDHRPDGVVYAVIVTLASAVP